MSVLASWIVLVSLALPAPGTPADEPGAIATKNALDKLLAGMEKIARDPNLTTANKTAAAVAEMEKFNPQYKGKPLTIRLKVQDVLSSPKGNYVTAASPDLAGVQFYSAKFSLTLPKAEFQAITKESVLAVSGVFAGVAQPQGRMPYGVVEPRATVYFPLRANSSYKICLDNAYWRIETNRPTATIKPALLSSGPKTGPVLGGTQPSVPSSTSPSGAPSGEAQPGDTAANEPLPEDLVVPKGKKPPTSEKFREPSTRSIDDVKSFFAKGILAAANPTTGVGKSTPTRPTTALYAPSGRLNTGTRTGAGSSASGGASAAAYGKHNHVYTGEEILRRFGEPFSRTSSSGTETWTYNCKDGSVRVKFKPAGYAAGHAASMAQKARLEVLSVDASSQQATSGGGRF